MLYYNYWFNAALCWADAYLLRCQGQMILAANAESQQREYERRMQRIRLNKQYGGLR